MNFSVVILAGGQSRRMGRDKAWLPVDGQPLLARQIALVRQLEPTEIFISGRPGVNYSQFDCPVLTDRVADAGPMAGVECALWACAAPMLLVLAVDMPGMQKSFLRRLAVECFDGTGIVARVNRIIEPLGAFYPKSAQHIAEKRARSGLLAVADFAAVCEEAGLVRILDLASQDGVYFANLNTPEDATALERSGGAGSNAGAKPETGAQSTK